MIGLKLNDIIYAKTNADLINQLLNTNYKSWMRSSIKLPDEKRIWMIELGNFITPSCWINQLISADCISERHVGNNYEYQGHGTYWDALQRNIAWDASDRVVFEKVQTSTKIRKYIFRGVFCLNMERSTLNENVWEKNSDQYFFNC